MRVPRLSSLALLASVSVLAAPAWVGQAWADTPMVVTWSTWLRAGPDKEAKVLNELQAGQTVMSLGCAGGWCQIVEVYAVGYVPERLLAANAPPPPVPVPGAPCFAGERFTHEGPLKLRICPAKAPNTPDYKGPIPTP